MLLDLPCVIFAGGKSSRMGEDKSLLSFDGFDTLSQFQLYKLSKIFKNVYISSKDSSKFNFNANFIEDTNKNIFAPSVAFLSIFLTLKCESFFAISVDTPFITKEIIHNLFKQDSIKKADATIAKHTGGIEPLCGIYHSSLIEIFQAMIDTNEHRLNMMLSRQNINYVYFKDVKAFLNLNHPHEYQEALNLL